MAAHHRCERLAGALRDYERMAALVGLLPEAERQELLGPSWLALAFRAHVCGCREWDERCLDWARNKVARVGARRRRRGVEVSARAGGRGRTP